MYQPKFNSVLVEIDDKDAEWGGENSEAMLGKSYSKGKVVQIAKECLDTDSHPLNTNTAAEIKGLLDDMVGKQIMWNEGAEAGTTFEDDGKLYGMIYWFDIRGVKDAK